MTVALEVLFTGSPAYPTAVLYYQDGDSLVSYGRIVDGQLKSQSTHPATSGVWLVRVHWATQPWQSSPATGTHNGCSCSATNGRPNWSHSEISCTRSNSNSGISSSNNNSITNNNNKSSNPPGIFASATAQDDPVAQIAVKIHICQVTDL